MLSYDKGSRGDYLYLVEELVRSFQNVLHEIGIITPCRIVIQRDVQELCHRRKVLLHLVE